MTSAHCRNRIFRLARRVQWSRSTARSSTTSGSLSQASGVDRAIRLRFPEGPTTSVSRILCTMRRPLFTSLIVACAKPVAVPVQPTPSLPSDACALVAASSPVTDRLPIGVAGLVDPGHAPIPTNDAERFVFRQVFETLVRLDCTGAVRPGLAESWQVADDGRQWTFTIRPDGRFSDGTPVTGQSIVDSWS